MKKRRSHAADPQKQAAAGPQVRRQPRLEAQFLEDLQYWIKVEPRTAAHVLELVRAVLRDPFAGAGKPELLCGEGGVWSRRISGEHRLTYRVTAEHVDFLQARFHYAK